MMFSIFIGSCGIAVSFIPVLLSTSQTHCHLKDEIISACYYFEGVFALCLIAFCLWLIIKQKDLIQRGHVRFANNNHISRRRSRIRIVVFGIGGTLFIICTVMNRALQKQVFPSLNNCALLLSFSIYIVTIFKYDGASLKNKVIFHYSIALMIGANIWSWITIAVYPLYEAISNYSCNLSMNTSNEFHELGESSYVTVFYIFDILEGFLQPFLVEFLTISTGCLLTLWQTMRHGSISVRDVPARRSQFSEENIRCEYSDILLSAEEDDQSEHGEKCSTRNIVMYIVTAISILVATGFFIAIQILSTGPFGQVVDLEDNTRTTYRVILETFIFLPLIVLNIFSLSRLQRCTTNMPLKSQLTSSGYLLLFTTCARFVFNLWKLATNIMLLNISTELSTSTIAFYFFYTGMFIIFCWSQTQHMITLNYLHRAGKDIPEISKLILIYLTSINFAEWMVLAFAHEWIKHKKGSTIFFPEIALFFGQFDAKIFILFLSPLFEMYHFHSAMMACECLHGSLNKDT